MSYDLILPFDFAGGGRGGGEGGELRVFVLRSDIASFGCFLGTFVEHLGTKRDALVECDFW